MVDKSNDIQRLQGAISEMDSLSQNMVPTIYQQTGWKRPFPATICQDFYVLKEISEYSFDLSDKDFVAYCQRRGVLQRAGEKRRYEFTADHHATKEQFFSDDDIFRFSIEYMGKRKRFPDDDMEIQWGIMLSAKGAFQDCWELYQTHVDKVHSDASMHVVNCINGEAENVGCNYMNKAIRQKINEAWETNIHE